MRRHGLVLAILAALMGAPSIASAASNVLHSPEASPTVRTIETAFVLRFGHDGGFPAGGVEGPLLVDLVRIVAIWGPALLGLAVAGLVLITVRRRRQTEEGDAEATAADTTALLERRATRRAKVVLDEDPIVASMKLDETPVRNRRRADRRRGERWRPG